MIERYPFIEGNTDLLANPLVGMDQYQLEQLLLNGWRLTPATMAVKITNGRWIAAPHLLHLSIVVTNAIMKGGQIVLVTMPPRHGKSEFLSVHTPIWYLDTFPQNRIILASYGAELAQEFGLKVRDTLMDEDLHSLLRVRLRKDRKRADDFKTTLGGGMISVGVGGTATGKGANLFLIDDYVKNAEEALSEAQKKKAFDWFQSTAFTRLEPGATVIVLATRWDKKDLIGMILEMFAEMEDKGFDPPIIVNLPAEARPGDPIGRPVGAPLWPERYDLKALARIKAVLGSYWYAGLYQQDPPQSMNGMNLGSKLKYIDRGELPHYSRLTTMRIYDFAATPEGGDFTAGPLMHYDKESDRTYISEMIHKQYSPHMLEQVLRATAEIDGTGVTIWVEQEPGSSGKWSIEHLQTDVLPEYDIRGEKSTGPIEVRAQPFLAAVEAGKVYCVRGSWNPKLVEELDGFPEGEHDDMIVACSLGFRKLSKSRFGGIVWGRNRNREGRRPTETDRVKVLASRRRLIW